MAAAILLTAAARNWQRHRLAGSHLRPHGQQSRRRCWRAPGRDTGLEEFSTSARDFSLNGLKAYEHRPRSSGLFPDRSRNARAAAQRTWPDRGADAGSGRLRRAARGVRRRWPRRAGPRDPRHARSHEHGARGDDLRHLRAVPQAQRRGSADGSERDGFPSHPGIIRDRRGRHRHTDANPQGHRARQPGGREARLLRSAPGRDDR